MGEKEFNTNEVEEEMSLSGQLSRRRRQRRMTEESNSSAVGADEKNADSTGDASEMEGVSIRSMYWTGQNCEGRDAGR